MPTMKATSNAEIISYFLNMNPELKEEIDLPVQGESTVEIGRLIVDNGRYKNAFINTINLIGLTIIKENRWKNPWQVFTDKGRLRFGQQIRELILDLAKVHDYNEFYEYKDKFLDTEVPNVYNYIHQLNFQKWYETTVNDGLLRMAFNNEEGDGLYNFINECVANLYETYEYDKYLVDKYQLCRRIVDGTVPVKTIDTSAGARSILAQMKGVSNLMSFKSPNYNPAGVRRATKHEQQYLLIDAQREGINSTEIFATSYFLNEAQAKSQMALIDTFSETDDVRLEELLKDAYTPFTSTEKEYLAKILGVLFADDLFMDYYYALDDSPEGKEQTEFRNPTSLDRNIFLHTWQVISTSPFANVCVFIANDSPAVSSVSVSPSTASITKGQSLDMSASVSASNFANKSVFWSINKVAETNGAKINQLGKLQVPSTYATTNETLGKYDIEIATALTTGDKITVDGVTYTVGENDDTAVKQATALATALNTTAITTNYTISRNSATVTLTEVTNKGGLVGMPEVEVTSDHPDYVEVSENTKGVIKSATIIVTATSIYDKTKSGTATVTVV